MRSGRSRIGRGGWRRSIWQRCISNNNNNSSSNNNNNNRPQTSNNDYHDYHAQPLPDPKLDSGGSSAGSTNGSDIPIESRNGSDNAVAGKHVCTDSSSGDEDMHTNKKRRLTSLEPAAIETTPGNGTLSTSNSSVTTPLQPTKDNHTSDVNAVRDPIIGSTLSIADPTAKQHSLPANITRPVAEGNINSRLSSAPIVPLLPFVGIGKRAITAPATANSGTTTTTNIVKNLGVRMIPNTMHPAVSSSNGSESAQVPTHAFPPHDISSSKLDGESGNDEIVQSTRNVTSLIGAYNDNCSEDMPSLPQIQAYYHMNEDDMLLTEYVLMCPFIF